MKKLFILLFVLSIASPTFAGLKTKNIVGKWKSTLVVSNAEMTGSLIFFQKNGELEGEYIPSEGIKSTISKIKVNKKDNTLCFEIPRETDVPIEFILIVEGDKFKGKGWINEVSFEITGEKISTN